MTCRVDNKFHLKGTAPAFQLAEKTQIQKRSKPQTHAETINTSFLFSNRAIDSASQLHAGTLSLKSEASGNNGAEESDVTTDCSLCNNVSFNRLVSSWPRDNHSTVRVPPDRQWPPTAASVHSQGHMGGMWPARAHVDQLNEGIMRHGGRVIHA